MVPQSFGSADSDISLQKYKIISEPSKISGKKFIPLPYKPCEGRQQSYQKVSLLVFRTDGEAVAVKGRAGGAAAQVPVLR